MEKKITSGFFFIDKPLHITSRSVCQEVQNKLKIKSLGHTGTLDPLASGLMILVVGEARKLQNMFTGHDKEYEVTIALGASSPTDDREGTVVAHSNPFVPSYAEVKKSLDKFKGEIWQIPPQFSAVRVKGKRAHKLARKGESVELSPRQVNIYKIDLVAYNFPYAKLFVKCSSGTYIRSLARDLGKTLKSGAYVHDLRRTSVGQFTIDQASCLDRIEWENLASLENVLKDYPKAVLPVEMWDKIRNGQRVAWEKNIKSDTNPIFISIEGKIVAIARVEEGRISSQKLLLAQDFSF